MADKDAIAKEFMQNPKVFADLFNFKIYDGRQVIKPENLTSLDPTALAIPFGLDGKPYPIHASIGISEFKTSQTSDIFTCFKIADEKMYARKRAYKSSLNNKDL